jgi:hypothetical protein
VKEIIKTKRELYEIIALHSGNPYEKIEKDSDRDYWMTSQEAKDYGMIDEILQRKQADTQTQAETQTTDETQNSENATETIDETQNNPNG